MVPLADTERQLWSAKVAQGKVEGANTAQPAKTTTKQPVVETTGTMRRHLATGPG